MKQITTTRKSHCNVCGKRLSEKTASGAIRWKPGHVDDSGIYCLSCNTSKSGRNLKNAYTGY